MHLSLDLFKYIDILLPSLIYIYSIYKMKINIYMHDIGQSFSMHELFIKVFSLSCHINGKMKCLQDL